MRGLSGYSSAMMFTGAAVCGGLKVRSRYVCVVARGRLGLCRARAIACMPVHLIFVHVVRLIRMSPFFFIFEDIKVFMKIS